MPSPRVAVVGAGMSGLAMAAHLKRAGIETFTVFEAGETLGGTWRDNTYPGLSCDVPSHFYEFRFAPNPEWSRWFSPGEEIFRYFDRVADELDLHRHVRLRSEVVSVVFGEDGWTLETRDGHREAFDFVVSACGVLRIPRVPEIPGLGDFAGAAFHSARWDHDVELRGRRVGVVGTGSTGAQIVAALGGVAERVVLFQRTPQWVLTVPNPRHSAVMRALLRRFPALDRAMYDLLRASFELSARALTEPGLQRRMVQAFARRSLRRGVSDPDLRRRLTPADEPLCKRLVISPSFYEAVSRPDVELVTAPIARVEAEGVVTADGATHELDVLALATGFDAHAYMQPMEVVGRDGRRLAEAWSAGPRAHLTVAVPGFPNFFMLMGPHSPVGNYSLTQIADTQARYIAQWLELWRDGRYATTEPTAAATERFNAGLRAAATRTVWATGCDSWYLDADGVPELWTWRPQRHRAMLARPRLEDHELRPATGVDGTNLEPVGSP